MNKYATTAIVEDHGHIHVAGVPFEAGTEVEVVIRERVATGEDAEPDQIAGPHTPATAIARAARLFAALDEARNTEPVGPLRREELYDRDVLR